MAIGQVITLATNTNPTKGVSSKKLLPRLQHMLDSFCKEDPPATKQLPVEANVPEFLVKVGMAPESRKFEWAIGDLILIAFYHLLRIGEYTTKGAQNNSKQTEEFKMGDIMLFAKDVNGNLGCFLRDALDDLIASSEGATRKLDNQKNGWKGVCVYHEANGNRIFCLLQLHLSTPYSRASRSNGLTLTHSIVAVLMPWLYQAILILKCRKWADGGVPLSKSTYGMNLHVFPLECHGTCRKRLAS
jgi:hypothetical protein